MADSLKIGNLSLNDSQHAPQPHTTQSGRAAYIPPHLRNRQMGGGMGMDGATPPQGGPQGGSGGNAGAWSHGYVLHCLLLLCDPEVM